MISPKRPRVAIHKAHVIKDRTARFLDDREGNFHGRAPHRLATSGLAVLLRTNLTKREAAEIIRTAEEESLKDWHFVAAAPLAYGRDLAVNEQDKILRQMKILRSL